MSRQICVQSWKGIVTITYRRYIFDLGGTPVNSIYAVQESVNDTLSYWNMCEISAEESQLYVGNGYEKLLERPPIACGDKEPTYYEEAAEWYQDILRERYTYRVEVYEGTEELLEFLESQGIFIIMPSNKSHPRTLDNVQGVFGKGHFDLVCGEQEDKGIKKKSYPDGIWAIVEELGLSKGEILYPGDTNMDMETGDNTRVDTVGVTWGLGAGGGLMALHPAFITSHPSQVVQYIRDVNGIKWQNAPEIQGNYMAYGLTWPRSHGHKHMGTRCRTEAA